MHAPSKIGRKYGLKRRLWDMNDDHYSIPNGFLSQELPPIVDHRSLCYPVGDQGQVGACTGFAGTRLLGFDRNRQGLALFPYSELYLYYKTRSEEGTTGSDAGATIKDTITAALTYGVCSETLWPYVETNVTKRPPGKCTKDAIQHRAAKPLAVPQSLLHLKSVLFGGDSIMIGISAYESFESHVVQQTGMVPLPQQGEQLLGGHALLVVGYQDDTRHFIVENSWSTNFGDQGFIYLPYDYLERADLSGDFWTIQAVS